jgi:hypothetical protein
MFDYQLTVQGAIDQLMAIDDKTQPLQVDIFDNDGCGLNYEKIEMSEYPKSPGFDQHVEIQIHLEKLE